MVFLPGKSHGQKSLAGYSPWSGKEFDTTEQRSTQAHSLLQGAFWCKVTSLTRASLVAQLVKNPPAMRETWVQSLVGKIPWRRDRLPTPVLLGFPCSSAGKESSCNVGDLGSIPGLGRSPGEGNGYPLQYSGLENSIDYSPWGRKELDTSE